MMSPDAVRVAPFSAAARSRKACPAFFSVAAATPARAACSCEIFAAYAWTSTFKSFFRTPSLTPASTDSRSDGFKLKLARFWLITSPRA